MAKARAASKAEPAGAGCGCAAHAAAGRHIGPGAQAAAVDPEIKAANLTHLRRIEGQVRGVAAMIENDRYCADIITQISAVRESLHTVARNLMRNHLTHCAAQAMLEEGRTREQMIEELLDLVGKIAR